MKLYAVFPLMMSAVCLTVAVNPLLLGIRKKNGDGSLAFAVNCLVVMAYCLACAGQYDVDGPGQSLPWLRLEAIALNLAGFTLAWFLAELTAMMPKTHLAAILLWSATNAIVQLVGFGDLTWESATSIVHTVGLPFGATVVYREVGSGILTDIQHLAGLALFVYFFSILVRYSRNGHRHEAGKLLVALFILLAGYANDLAINLGLYSSLYLAEYAWLSMIVLVGFQRAGLIVESTQAKRALAESERRYRSIFESLQDVYFRTDGDGIIRLISPSVRGFLGYEPEEVIGKPDSFLYDDKGQRDNLYTRVRRFGAVSDFEVRLRAGDSSLRDASLSAHAVRDMEETARGSPSPGSGIMPKSGPDYWSGGVEGTFRDVSDRKRVEEDLRVSLEEKNVLLKEIHHRVKNNLQVISSLLYLQEKNMGDPKFAAVMEECRSQINSMALIHDDLYQSRDVRKIDFGKYLKNLVSRLIASYRRTESIAFIPVVEEISLTIEKAIPCGLIVNELCSNTLKYAFPPDSRLERKPELRIGLRRLEDDRVSLTVADNGVGLPEGMDFVRSPSLGLQIVQRLVHQIGGSIRTEGKTGVGVVIEFPEQVG
jgi:PAS domain S-box-containing protein